MKTSTNTLNQAIFNLQEMHLLVRGAGVSRAFANIQINYGVKGDKITVNLGFPGYVFKGQSSFNVESAINEAIEVAKGRGHEFVDTLGRRYNPFSF